MQTPAILPLSTLVLLAISTAACGTAPSRAAAEGSGGSLTSGPPSTGGAATSGPPSCSLMIDGAVVLSVPETSPKAYLQGQSGAAALTLECDFTRGDIAYELILFLDDLSGPSPYTANRAWLDRYCQVSSCPGDYSFAAYAPAPTCTVAFDTFAPATRGGMSGSFTCPDLPIDDFEDPSDTQAVAIHGTFVFPPAVPGEAADAGTSGDAGPDGGPPACTMQVSAPFETGTLSGQGGAIGGTAECAASGGGVTFQLSAQLGAEVTGGLLEVSGASFCSADCFEDYWAPASCDLQVLVDEGVGGRFAAQIVCHALALEGLAADAGGGTVDVIANIDGIHAPSPPPG